MRNFGTASFFLLLTACGPTVDTSVESPEPMEPLRWSVAIHGGAGHFDTEVLSGAEQAAYSASLSAALETGGAVLEAGGLVIVPTETVYGIACNPAVPEAMNTLVAAKGRDGKKPIARLACDPKQVAEAAANWTAGLARS